MWSSYSPITSDISDDDSIHPLRRWKSRWESKTGLVSQILLLALVGSLGFLLGFAVRTRPGERVDAVSRGVR